MLLNLTTFADYMSLIFVMSYINSVVTIIILYNFLIKCYNIPLIVFLLADKKVTFAIVITFNVYIHLVTDYLTIMITNSV